MGEGEASASTTASAAPLERAAESAGARRAWQPRGLVLAMLSAIALVAALLHWDEQREATAGFEAFAAEQADLAASAASGVRTRLATARRDAFRFAEDARAGRPTPAEATLRYASVRVAAASDPPAMAPEAGTIVLPFPIDQATRVDLGLPATELVSEASRLERPRELVVLLARPGQAGLTTTDGRIVTGSPVEAAFRAGETTVRLQRPDAAALGLAIRMAAAGLAGVDGGTLGRFGVAIVASAAKERDREARARYRLWAGVLLAAGLVLGFGTVALGRQRRELDLARELALAELARGRDERLARAGRAAMMGTLATGIAHELSTPLGVISGRAEQLAPRLAGDERGARAVAAILAETERMSATIRGFLDLARGGRPSLSQSAPGDLAKGAVRLVEHRFEKAGVSLAVDVGAGLPALRCDARLLEHALVNLLLNACEACVRGGEVSLSATSDDARVTFVVEDDGAGIAPSDVSRVTEPFFTTKPPGQGTGLGLAITSEIVKAHHGTLALENRPEGGTRATIGLPRDGAREEAS
jgi:signal transduction histidine kinase